mgnify:CR=1 FL=1
MINLYIIHVKFWQNYFIGKDRSSPMIIVKIKNVAFATFLFWCPKWDSNPHGFPNDFESFASAIPPHRLIFNFGTLVPVSEDWRDVQEGCKKSCFDKPSKFNGHS